MNIVQLFKNSNIEIGRNSVCYCGSGAKYKNCCSINEHIPWVSYSEIEKSEKIVTKAGKIIPSIYTSILDKCINTKCIIPECNNQPINSHLIPKNYLQKISEQGHLYVIGKEGLNKLGIKNVLGEKIWCSYHDAELFVTIDADFEILNQEKINLLFYKTISNEFIKKQASLRMMYSLLKLNKDSLFLLDSYIGTYLGCKDFKTFFQINNCSYMEIELPLRQEPYVILQGATNLLFGVSGVKISDLHNFNDTPKPCVVISYPDLQKKVQRVVFITATTDFCIYEENIFSYIRLASEPQKYTIINNIFLSFENMVYLSKDELLSNKIKERFLDNMGFMTELTNKDDLLKDSKIMFI